MPRVLAVVAAAVLLSGCAAGPGAGSDAPTTLAKVDGWHESLRGEDVFAVLELAYDRETAERLWVDNVPDDLPERAGRPLEPGVYGDLADVDLETSVVALWSSGESGSCPEWLEDASMGRDVVDVDVASDGEVCTADFNPYRLVLVLDRDAVPAQADLPVPLDVGGNVVVPSEARAYGTDAGEPTDRPASPEGTAPPDPTAEPEPGTPPATPDAGPATVHEGDGTYRIHAGPDVAAADLDVVRAFVALASEPSAAAADDVPLAEEVLLGLGPEVVGALDRPAVGDAAAWSMDVPEFRGYVGPFSALDVVRRHVATPPEGARTGNDLRVVVGEHPHCVSPPVAPPPELSGLRRVSVQPVEESISSCLAWFAVDLFVDEGRVDAVTLDLWEP